MSACPNSTVPSREVFSSSKSHLVEVFSSRPMEKVGKER
jgi:hypothetical protein